MLFHSQQSCTKMREGSEEDGVGSVCVLSECVGVFMGIWKECPCLSSTPLPSKIPIKCEHQTLSVCL